MSFFLNLDPIVQAAVITVGGMVITCIATLIISSRNRKADAKDKFFFEVFPKRIEVYDDVLKELKVMQETGQALLNFSLTENIAAKKMRDDKHNLDSLLTRLIIYGNVKSQTIIMALRYCHEYPAKLNETFDGSFVHFGNWISAIAEARLDFADSIRKDMGINFIDKTIDFYFVNVFKRHFHSFNNFLQECLFVIKTLPSRWRQRILIKEIKQSSKEYEKNLKAYYNRPKD